MNLEVAQLVIKTPLDQLKSVSIVEDLICQAGLHNDDRIVRHYGVAERFIKSGGMLQQPRQLAEALVFLSNHEIKKYLEIGTFYGAGTCFISAYFTKFDPSFEAITVDNSKGIDAFERERLRDMGVKIHQVGGTSDDIKGTKSDLCFIDGDHNYEWVVRDYENVGRHARIVMFHDIIDEWVAGQGSDGGSKKHWPELKEKYPERRFYEFTYHPDNKPYFGIGIMIKGDK